MSCNCGDEHNGIKNGVNSVDEFAVSAFLEPSWKNIMLWLTFFIAVATFLKK